MSQAGAVLLIETIRATGLDRALREALEPWRKPTAVHDPAKVVLDLAVTLAAGGDCLADIAVLRDQPVGRAVFGLVASDPTVSRTIDALAADAGQVLTAINGARSSARRAAWTAAGQRSPDHEVDAARPIVVDVDATLVTAHSEKEHAAPTFKRGHGFHPLWVFADHGTDRTGESGTGEPLAVLLRRGNAGSNTAADHITVLREALQQLPFRAEQRPGSRPGRKVLASQGRRRRGPRRDRTAGRAITSGLSAWESWVFAAGVAITIGTPFASDRTWIFEPGLPRSTGLGPRSARPLFARTLAPSTIAEAQSSCPAAPNWSSTPRCSRRQTPACVQAANPRCAVAGEIPNSLGRCRQAHPLVST